MTKIITTMEPFLNIILPILILLLPLTATAASDDMSAVESPKVTAVEQTAETSVDKPKKVSGYCESEVDRQICNTVNKALALYYQIANHVPPGDYERNYEMKKLIYNIGVTRQSTINEFGHPGSIDMYTAFIDFVKFKEKTEMLFSRQEYDEADFNREIAFKNHDKIIEYCKTCVEVLK